MPSSAAGASGPRIGTAAWALSSGVAERFGSGSSLLERYATRFDAVEINSSFYRPHRRQTYVRWAASVPARFRFSVKVPKAITHERRLQDCGPALHAFLDQVGGLGDTLGPLLVQLPPSLAFDDHVASTFLDLLRGSFEGSVACEPRHATWFTPEVDAVLVKTRIARVAADPARVPAAGQPSGWRGLTYHRLHGSPKTYISAYAAADLQALSDRLEADAAPERWCIFDNTATGAATLDALLLLEGLGGVAEKA